MQFMDEVLEKLKTVLILKQYVKFKNLTEHCEIYIVACKY